MTHLPPTLDRPKFLEALGAFLNITMPACAQVTYRLVGTGAALLHGVTLPTGDIDILVRERKDVDAFGAALSSLTCLESPAWLPHARQYYGNWEVRGVEVGISTVEVPSDADTVETVGRGPWEHLRPPVHCGRHSVAHGYINSRWRRSGPWRGWAAISPDHPFRLARTYERTQHRMDLL